MAPGLLASQQYQQQHQQQNLKEFVYGFGVTGILATRFLDRFVKARHELPQGLWVSQHGLQCALMLLLEAGRNVAHTAQNFEQLLMLRRLAHHDFQVADGLA